MGKVEPAEKQQVKALIEGGTVNVGNLPTDYAREVTLASELIRRVKGEYGLLKQVGVADYRLDVFASYVANPSNLDVPLSTRASEVTLSAIKNALASVGTDKLRTSLVDALPAGTNKIGSVDVGNFPTDYAKDSTLSSELVRKVKGDQGLLKQVSSTDLRLDVYASYVANPSNLDIALSTRASEVTLSAIKNALASVGTDKIRVSVVDALPAGTNKIGTVDVGNFPVDYAKDATLSSELTRKVKGDQGFLKQVSSTDLRLDIYASYVANPSNLDVALSTRASEATLQAIKNALASVGTDKLRTSLVDPIPAGTNKIGSIDAYKAGTWNIDNLLNPHPIQLTPEHKLLDANQYSGTFSPTAAGSTTIIAAVSGKVIRVYDFSLWNSGTGDVTVELYFGTSGKRLFKGLLAAKTGVLKTYVRPWESNAGDSLVLALNAAGTCDYCVGAVQA
jgi:uncharacterized protein YpuA (DUF1002 family)